MAPTYGYPDLEVRSHEYIHKLQYESSLMTFGKYLIDAALAKAFNLPFGDETYSTEAIGYLWEFWTLSYHKWELEPWQIWRPL